ncbi:hypothetical protein CEUSTIGMA_g4986.t1 [Chlamydomonas eustigma]|uniref:Uncharacterized protein n=1 Tax=Chlamydomonas eustigma TaxID=1157962 RepID=A0A250X3S0_9CHLO|nr:hypothetical protein CEUSTIGMA_g4986.t1 [Chlamydomonas eustigma]|eukprot:GAX77542.1 hypothetical protein CEUSTIGMA_g4986.t1 [Chlamydomonas eustigma]
MALDQPVSQADPVDVLLQRFLHIQQQRAEHYTIFNDNFKTYLKNRSNTFMRESMQLTTTAFSNCSKQVRLIETGLLAVHDREDLAKLIRTIQDHEREKLRLTLTLNSLKSAFEFKTFTWQQEEDADILESSSQQRTCACCPGPHADGTGGSGQPAALEPTESEYTLAVQDAQLTLNDHVMGINEVMEEIREALASLNEE